MYVVLSVARTNVEDTLFEAVRVAQKLGLKLDEVLLEAIIGDGAPPGKPPKKAFKPVKEAPVPTKRNQRCRCHDSPYMYRPAIMALKLVSSASWSSVCSASARLRTSARAQKRTSHPLEEFPYLIAIRRAF